MSLAFADNAFEDIESPDRLKRIRVPSYRQSIELKWKQSILETLVFRQVHATVQGARISPERAFTAGELGTQLRNLGHAAGFSQNVTPYFLQREGVNRVEGKLRPYT